LSDTAREVMPSSEVLARWLAVSDPLPDRTSPLVRLPHPSESLASKR